MGKLPGSRMILVASPGFQTGTMEAETSALIDRAVRADVVINSMDVTGLWGGPSGADCSPSLSIGSAMQQSAVDVLSSLAYGTGGRVFHNNNDLLRGFREVGAPSEVSYRLGFAPSNASDSRFHPVHVQVNSAQRYEVQTRPGYFAAGPDVANPMKRILDRAVLGTEARDELPVRASLLADRVNGMPAIQAVAHVDVAKLQFRRDAGRRVQELTVVAALFDPEGNFVTGKEGGISLSLKDSSYTALSTQGINCTLTLLAPTGTYRLRMVVMDTASGRLVASSEPITPW
jgi:hypothetical protein